MESVFTIAWNTQRDRRLTFGVMIQPEALRGFIERAGALPRGSGFIAAS